MKSKSLVKYDAMRLSDALKATVIHSGTKEAIDKWDLGLAMIVESKTMRERWEKYCREFSYAKGILFDEVCEKIRAVCSEMN